MKCQNVFSGKDKKKYFNMSSAGTFTQSIIKELNVKSNQDDEGAIMKGSSMKHHTVIS